MNLTDEVLSAFLDGELPEADMQTIRNLLVDDPSLGERLADLAAVDRAVAEHYGVIDEQALPEAVSELLKPESATAATVVAFPYWRRARQGLQRRAGTAVAAALALGFGLAQFWDGAPVDSNADWQQVAEALETTPSGKTRILETDTELTPRLTFTNHAGEFCRQFLLQEQSKASEKIACRSSAETAGWVEMATVTVPKVESDNRYQTASGGSVLDGVLDQMIAGEVIDPARERQLLTGGWRTE